MRKKCLRLRRNWQSSSIISLAPLMNMRTRPFLAFLLFFLLAVTGNAQTLRWTEGQANAWYSKEPWLVGSNYIPATAINELEMWQADTFDPGRIDLSSVGLNRWESTPCAYSCTICFGNRIPKDSRRHQYLPRDRRSTSHQVHVCVVRFLLGSRSEAGQAA